MHPTERTLRELTGGSQLPLVDLLRSHKEMFPQSATDGLLLIRHLARFRLANSDSHIVPTVLIAPVTCASNTVLVGNGHFSISVLLAVNYDWN
jgi:hypothetical protein